MPRAITSSSIVIRVLWSGGLVRWLLPAAATPMNDIAPGTLRSTYEKSSAPIIGAGIACQPASPPRSPAIRSEEHTSELQSLMRISYAVFCLKKKILHIRSLQHDVDNITSRY